MKFDVTNVLWTLITVMGSILTFFLVRYINRKDKRDDDVFQKLDRNDKRAFDFAEQIEKLAGQISAEVVKIEKLGINHERQLNKEIASIREEVRGLKDLIASSGSSIQVIIERLATLKGDLDKLCGSVKTNTEQLAAHHNSLGLGAQTIHKLREDSRRQDREIAEIRTVATKIGKDAVLISQKKVKKNDND